jgi:uncharacterized protein YbaP (TraB family)
LALSLLSQQTPAAKSQRQFLLWKVTSPTATVYLVGSMHILASKDVYPLPGEVEKAFADSSVLAVEADVRNVDQQHMMEMVQKYGMYTAGDSLSHHLSKSTADALASFCSNNGFPCATLEPLRPWMAGMLVSVWPIVKAGVDPKNGIDMHFLNEVKTNQRVAELESADAQFELLSGQSEEEQDKFLAYSLEGAGKMQELEKAYLGGDIDALLKDLPPSSQLTEHLINERNVRMSQKVADFLKAKGTSFVVVGAAHVIGDKGIANLLQQQGYKVERTAYPW